MNKRRRGAKLWRTGNSTGVTVPPDWMAGNGLAPGDIVEVLYDGVLVIATRDRAQRALDVLRRFENEEDP